MSCVESSFIELAPFFLLRDEDLIYSQLYIHDTEHALNNRLNQHNRCNPCFPLDPYTLNLLQGVLHQSHPAIHLYEQAIERTINMPPDQQFSVALHFDQNCDKNRYNLPDATTREIAVIVIGDGERYTGSQ